MATQMAVPMINSMLEDDEAFGAMYGSVASDLLGPLAGMGISAEDFKPIARQFARNLRDNILADMESILAGPWALGAIPSCRVPPPRRVSLAERRRKCWPTGFRHGLVRLTLIRSHSHFLSRPVRHHRLERRREHEQEGVPRPEPRAICALLAPVGGPKTRRFVPCLRVASELADLIRAQAPPLFRRSAGRRPNAASLRTVPSAVCTHASAAGLLIVAGTAQTIIAEDSKPRAQRMSDDDAFKVVCGGVDGLYYTIDADDNGAISKDEICNYAYNVANGAAMVAQAAIAILEKSIPDEIYALLAKGAYATGAEAGVVTDGKVLYQVMEGPLTMMDQQLSAMREQVKGMGGQNFAMLMMAKKMEEAFYKKLEAVADQNGVTLEQFQTLCVAFHRFLAEEASLCLLNTERRTEPHRVWPKRVGVGIVPGTPNSPRR